MARMAVRNKEPVAVCRIGEQERLNQTEGEDADGGVAVRSLVCRSCAQILSHSLLPSPTLWPSLPESLSSKRKVKNTAPPTGNINDGNGINRSGGKLVSAISRPWHSAVRSDTGEQNIRCEFCELRVHRSPLTALTHTGRDRRSILPHGRFVSAGIHVSGRRVFACRQRRRLHVQSNRPAVAHTSRTEPDSLSFPAPAEHPPGTQPVNHSGQRLNSINSRFEGRIEVSSASDNGTPYALLRVRVLFPIIAAADACFYLRQKHLPASPAAPTHTLPA